MNNSHFMAVVFFFYFVLYGVSCVTSTTSDKEHNTTAHILRKIEFSFNGPTKGPISIKIQGPEGNIWIKNIEGKTAKSNDDVVLEGWWKSPGIYHVSVFSHGSEIKKSVRINGDELGIRLFLSRDENQKPLYLSISKRIASSSGIVVRDCSLEPVLFSKNKSLESTNETSLKCVFSNELAFAVRISLLSRIEKKINGHWVPVPFDGLSCLSTSSKRHVKIRHILVPRKSSSEQKLTSCNQYTISKGHYKVIFDWWHDTRDIMGDLDAHPELLPKAKHFFSSDREFLTYQLEHEFKM